MIFGPDDHAVRFDADGKPIIFHPLTCRIHVCPLLALIAPTPCEYVRTSDEGTAYCSLGTA